MTRHIIIQKTDLVQFNLELDKMNKEYNVFATQTHFVVLGEKLIYNAVLFIK